MQACFAGDTTLSVFIVADSCGVYHLIDDIRVNGTTFTDAANNSNGNSDPAGPSATTDPSLLPTAPVLSLVRKVADRVAGPSRPAIRGAP